MSDLYITNYSLYRAASMLLLRNSQYNFNLHITDNSYYDKHVMLQLSAIYIQYWLYIQNEDTVNNIYNNRKEGGLGQKGPRLLIAAEKVYLGRAMYVDFWSTFFLNLQKVFLTDKNMVFRKHVTHYDPRWCYLYYYLTPLPFSPKKITSWLQLIIHLRTFNLDMKRKKYAFNQSIFIFNIMKNVTLTL